MSYKSGIAALNLEFTDRVPRTEYSAESRKRSICYNKAYIKLSIKIAESYVRKVKNLKNFLKFFYCKVNGTED